MPKYIIAIVQYCRITLSKLSFVSVAEKLSGIKALQVNQYLQQPCSGVIHFLLCSMMVLLLTAVGLTLIWGYHGLFIQINRLGAVLPEAFWASITVLGDVRVALAILLVFVVKQVKLLELSLIASIIGTLISQSLKQGFWLARPSKVLVDVDFNQIGQVLSYASFPSGHTLTAAILTGLLCLFARFKWQKITLMVLFGLIGLSRVMVGAHWPVDVLVGGALGLAVVLLSVIILSFLTSYIARYSSRYAYLHQLKLAVRYTVLSLLIYADMSLFFNDCGYPSARDFLVILASLSLSAYLLQCLHLNHQRRLNKKLTFSLF